MGKSNVGSIALSRIAEALWTERVASNRSAFATSASAKAKAKPRCRQANLRPGGEWFLFNFLSSKQNLVH